MNYSIFSKTLFTALMIFAIASLYSCGEDKKPEEKQITEQAPPPPPKKEVEKKDPPPPPPVKEKTVIRHKVKEGEWLFELSREYYGNISGWEKIYNANKSLIDNPDIIYPNQELIIPE